MRRTRRHRRPSPRADGVPRATGGRTGVGMNARGGGEAAGGAKKTAPKGPASGGANVSSLWRCRTRPFGCAEVLKARRHALRATRPDVLPVTGAVSSGQARDLGLRGFGRRRLQRRRHRRGDFRGSSAARIGRPYGNRRSRRRARQPWPCGAVWAARSAVSVCACRAPRRARISDTCSSFSGVR